MADTDVLILGGGLAGLSLAADLTRRGIDWHLVEGRDRLGGRILSERIGGAGFDLGPAWFWPGQPRLLRLVRALGLTVFAQYAEGALSFEDEGGRVVRGRGYASMEGSYRLDGGLQALIEGVAAGLDPGRISTGRPVTRLATTAAGVSVAAGADILTARCAVLALPPRLAAGLAFDPPLPAAALRDMAAVPTWMAGQAKAIALYDRPFWREAGLSGDAMSRAGPLAEIHDASPPQGGPHALFGFLGLPPQARRDIPALEAAIKAQLGRLFGPAAGSPERILVKDWAEDAMTSAPADLAPLGGHPGYGLPASLAALAERGVFFGGTEVAAGFGGYLEGALEAAEAAAAGVLQALSARP